MADHKRTARLFLQLRTAKRNTVYCLVPHNPDPRVATQAWRLWKPGGKKFYDISIDAKGHATCTCPDATYRQKDCKHVSSLRAFGLLPKDVSPEE